MKKLAHIFSDRFEPGPFPLEANLFFYVYLAVLITVDISLFTDLYLTP